MKIDGTLMGADLAEIPRLVRDFERAGFDGVFTGEAKHDPFLPLLLAAEHSRDLQLGTNIAIAFPRSPMHLANIGYDLQRYSRGRFTLGIGSQVKAHIEERYSATWSRPVARMGELIEAIRAVWRCWQGGESLAFRGDFYTLTLMTPRFDPGPNPFGIPRIYLAAVGERMTRMAGQVADGLIIHPFSTPEYIRKVSVPALEEGLTASGRTRTDVEVLAQVLVVTGGTEEELEQQKAHIRQQLAFYASTPNYRTVLDVHGWADVQSDLNELATQRRWSDMSSLIDDKMLEAFAVVGEPDKIGPILFDRYERLCDRISFYGIAGQEPAEWTTVLASLRRPS